MKPEFKRHAPDLAAGSPGMGAARAVGEIGAWVMILGVGIALAAGAWALLRHLGYLGPAPAEPVPVVVATELPPAPAAARAAEPAPLERRVAGARAVVDALPSEAVFEAARRAAGEGAEAADAATPAARLEGFLAGEPSVRALCAGWEEVADPGALAYELGEICRVYKLRAFTVTTDSRDPAAMLTELGRLRRDYKRQALAKALEYGARAAPQLEVEDQ